MGSFASRLVSTAFEAIVAGIAIDGILVLVRRVQLAFGVREGKENRSVHISHVS
jgi:hypothetical protein